MNERKWIDVLVLKTVYVCERARVKGKGNGGENVSIRHGWEQCFSRCLSWPLVGQPGSLVLSCFGFSGVVCQLNLPALTSSLCQHPHPPTTTITTLAYQITMFEVESHFNVAFSNQCLLKMNLYCPMVICHASSMDLPVWDLFTHYSLPPYLTHTDTVLSPLLPILIALRDP